MNHLANCPPNYEFVKISQDLCMSEIPEGTSSLKRILYFLSIFKLSQINRTTLAQPITLAEIELAINDFKQKQPLG